MQVVQASDDVSTKVFFFKYFFFLSNNNVQDDGVRDILEGLINQVNEDKTGKGLSILILWNNRLTKKSSPYLSRIIVCTIPCVIFYLSIFHSNFFF